MKKLSKIFLLVLSFLLISSGVFAASSVTVTAVKWDGTIREYIYEWTSHTDGTVSGCTNCSFAVNGYIIDIKTDPDGTDVPTSYSLVLNDDSGEDILQGSGATRSTTAIQHLNPQYNNGVLWRDDGNITISITGAGSSKKGKITVKSFKED